MTKDKNDDKPMPGQEICFFMDGSYDSSLSSLESFMSFMDDSEEEQVKTKKRSKPRRTLLHQRTASPTNATPSRASSNPEFGFTSPRPLPASSRWDTAGRSRCQSMSPGQPRRVSPRRGGRRPCPIISVDADKGLESDSQHSTDSLKVSMLEGDRWSADSSHPNASQCLLAASLNINQLNIPSAHSASLNFNNQSSAHSGRWQESYAGNNSGGDSGHESLSRWSASFTSSQMDQLSTKPRFPRRKRSGVALNSLLSTSNDQESLNNSNNSNNNNFSWNNHSMTSTTGEFTSTDVEEFAVETNTENNPATKTPTDPPVVAGLPALKAITSHPAVMKSPTPGKIKPRARLPHRQKSFGRGMSMGQAAKKAFTLKNPQLQRKRDSFVKQRSEPNINKSPSDCELSLSSHLSSEQQQSTSGGTASARRDSFRRQQSFPQSLLPTTTASEDEVVSKANKENPAQTAPLAALRKQKSLSNLDGDTPKLPERQSSQTSSAELLAAVSDHGGCCDCHPQEHQSNSKRGPQLPQRLPSESSHRALSSVASSEEDQSEQEEEGDHPEEDGIPAPPSIQRPPMMPLRKKSVMGSSLVSASTITAPTNKAPAAPALLEISETQLGNRRLSLTKQMSEPNALSLKKLMMFQDEDRGDCCWDSLEERLDVKANAAVLASCKQLLSGATNGGCKSYHHWNSMHRSSPELSILGFQSRSPLTL